MGGIRTTADSARSASSHHSGRGALLVAIGVFCSRIAGFVRESLFAHYFGNSDFADAFKAALRIPNFLQNLFGEGVLGASFIPVYSRQLHAEEKGAQGQSHEFAYAVGGILAGISATLSILGIIFSSILVDLITPGFEGEKRELTVSLVQILFPATGALMLSAWCLGVLNSHRKFLLSYMAPVVWNGAIIAALVFFGSSQPQRTLVVTVTWGVFAGSLLQFLVQLPSVMKLLGVLRFKFGDHRDALREVGRTFVPVVFGRGVVQVSAFLDSMFASLLSTGALSALTYAQMIYMLPLSLFAASVSASELPELSRSFVKGETPTAQLRERVDTGIRRIGFLIIPSCFVFIFLGSTAIRALYQSGDFGADDTALVSCVLAAMSIGLIPAALGRLYSSTLYAIGEPKVPVKISVFRVITGTALGGGAALYLPQIIGIQPQYGVALLGAGSGIASWAEFMLLTRAVNTRVGAGESRKYALIRCFAAGAIAAAAALVTDVAIHFPSYLIEAAIVFGVFGVVYLASAAALQVEECAVWVGRVLSRVRRSSDRHS